MRFLLGDAVDSVGYVFGGILEAVMNIFFLIWSLLAYVVRVVERVFLVLAGVNPIAGTTDVEKDAPSKDVATAIKDGAKADEKTGDIVSFMINNTIVRQLFQSLIVVAIALIMFFTILQIIREQYSNKDGGNPYMIVFRMFKGIITMLFITAFVIVGLQVSGFVLTALRNATNLGANQQSVTSNIFMAMARNANRLRMLSPAEKLANGGGTAKPQSSEMMLYNIAREWSESNGEEYKPQTKRMAEIHRMVENGDGTASAEDETKNAVLLSSLAGVSSTPRLVPTATPVVKKLEDIKYIPFVDGGDYYFTQRMYVYGDAKEVKNPGRYARDDSKLAVGLPSQSDARVFAKDTAKSAALSFGPEGFTFEIGSTATSNCTFDSDDAKMAASTLACMGEWAACLDGMVNFGRTFDLLLSLIDAILFGTEIVFDNPLTSALGLGDNGKLVMFGGGGGVFNKKLPGWAMLLLDLWHRGDGWPAIVHWTPEPNNDTLLGPALFAEVIHWLVPSSSRFIEMIVNGIIELINEIWQAINCRVDDFTVRIALPKEGLLDALNIDDFLDRFFKGKAGATNPIYGWQKLSADEFIADAELMGVSAETAKAVRTIALSPLDSDTAEARAKQTASAVELIAIDRGVSRIEDDPEIMSALGFVKRSANEIDDATMPTNVTTDEVYMLEGTNSGIARVAKELTLDDLKKGYGTAQNINKWTVGDWVDFTEGEIIRENDDPNVKYLYGTADGILASIGGAIKNAGTTIWNKLWGKPAEETAIQKLSSSYKIIQFATGKDADSVEVKGTDLGSISYQNPVVVNIFYDTWHFQFIVGFLCLGIAVGVFVNFAFGLIQRLLELIVLYIMSPITLAMYPFDNGSAFKSQFFTPFYRKVISIYAMIISMNIFFLLLPAFQSLKFFKDNTESVFVNGRNIIANYLMNAFVMVALLGLLPKVRDTITSMLGADSIEQKSLMDVAKNTMKQTGIQGHIDRAKWTGAKAVASNEWNRNRNAKRTVDSNLTEEQRFKKWQETHPKGTLAQFQNEVRKAKAPGIKNAIMRHMGSRGGLNDQVSFLGSLVQSVTDLHDDKSVLGSRSLGKLKQGSTHKRDMERVSDYQKRLGDRLGAEDKAKTKVVADAGVKGEANAAILDAMEKAGLKVEGKTHEEKMRWLMKWLPGKEDGLRSGLKGKSDEAKVDIKKKVAQMLEQHGGGYADSGRIANMLKNGNDEEIEKHLTAMASDPDQDKYANGIRGALNGQIGGFADAFGFKEHIDDNERNELGRLSAVIGAPKEVEGRLKALSEFEAKFTRADMVGQSDDLAILANERSLENTRRENKLLMGEKVEFNGKTYQNKSGTEEENRRIMNEINAITSRELLSHISQGDANRYSLTDHAYVGNQEILGSFAEKMGDRVAQKMEFAMNNIDKSKWKVVQESDEYKKCRADGDIRPILRALCAIESNIGRNDEKCNVFANNDKVMNALSDAGGLKTAKYMAEVLTYSAGDRNGPMTGADLNNAANAISFVEHATFTQKMEQIAQGMADMYARMEEQAISAHAAQKSTFESTMNALKEMSVDVRSKLTAEQQQHLDKMQKDPQYYRDSCGSQATIELFNKLNEEAVKAARNLANRPNATAGDIENSRKIDALAGRLENIANINNQAYEGSSSNINWKGDLGWISQDSARMKALFEALGSGKGH